LTLAVRAASVYTAAIKFECISQLLRAPGLAQAFKNEFRISAISLMNSNATGCAARRNAAGCGSWECQGILSQSAASNCLAPRLEENTGQAAAALLSINEGRAAAARELLIINCQAESALCRCDISDVLRSNQSVGGLVNHGIKTPLRKAAGS
jgi:hypothetical protein